MSLFKKKNNQYQGCYFYPPQWQQPQQYQAPQQPPKQTPKQESYYNTIPCSMFKTYPTNEGEGKECANALAQALAQHSIEAKTIYYTESPQVVQLLAIMDLPNSTKANTKARAIEKALSIYFQKPCRCTIDNGFRVEIPKKNRSLVGLGSVLAEDNNYTLPCSIGIDTNNDVVSFDLAKAPHLLIAGATGAGKSVCLNDIIMSLIQYNPPSNVAFVMIDPKKVELTHFANLKHLLCPIVYDVEMAKQKLQGIVNLMNERYFEMAKMGIKDVSEVKTDKFVRIVVVIDELSVMMLNSPRETEKLIETIAAQGRAAGIHLIVATQSPSSKVITGRIKANIPTRIALTTASITDSKVILDYAGAEKLLGKGDALLSTPYDTGFRRFQCAMVTTDEIRNAIHHACKDLHF